MCGIIQTPTNHKNFVTTDFPNLPMDVVTNMVMIGEDNHMPDSAIRLVLLMANKFSGTDFVLERVAISVYHRGQRLVTKKSLELEQDLFHLAMSGTVLHDINLWLERVDMKFMFMHCCGGEIHSLKHEDKALNLSRDGNLWRADMLRTNPEQTIVFDDQFAMAASKLSHEKSHAYLITQALQLSKETV